MTKGVETAGSLLSRGELAKRLRLRPCQLSYLLQSGVIPEPKLWAGGKRLFSEQEAHEAEECLKRPQKADVFGDRMCKGDPR
jgi:DNA-binding transcriptional MerR regulator